MDLMGIFHGPRDDKPLKHVTEAAAEHLATEHQGVKAGITARGPTLYRLLLLLLLLLLLFMLFMFIVAHCKDLPVFFCAFAHWSRIFFLRNRQVLAE